MEEKMEWKATLLHAIQSLNNEDGHGAKLEKRLNNKWIYFYLTAYMRISHLSRSALYSNASMGSRTSSSWIYKESVKLEIETEKH